VDVSVVDRNGKPVSDLGAGDITVTVEGRPRKVVSAQFLSTETTSSGQPVVPVVAPSFSSNVTSGAPPGRLVLLVVDQANIRLGNAKSALKTANGFIDRLGPGDRVAVITIPAPGPTVGLTLDRARVKAAISRINGFFDPRAPIHNIAIVEAFRIMDGDADTLERVIERECGPKSTGSCQALIRTEASQLSENARRRADNSLRSLMDLFATLKTIEGPKTVMLVSEGLITEQGQDRDRELARLSAEARASVYVLRLDVDFNDASQSRPVGQIDAEAQREGLDRIAGATRGVAMTVAGEGTGVFERMAREISASYLVAFEPDARDRDHRPHDIKVGVRRPGVVVRARRQFEMTPDTPPLTGVNALRDAIRAPLPRQELPIDVASYAFHSSSDDAINGVGGVRVAVTANVGSGFSAAAPMDVGYALIDSGDKVVDVRTGSGDLPLAGKSGALAYTTAFTLAPGDYTLKLAASDANGHVGSVEHLIHARLMTAGDVAIGDPVVTDAAEPTTSGRLPVRPAVASGRLQSSIEVRNGAPDRTGRVTVRVEIARTDDGDPIMMTAASLANTQDPQRQIAYAAVDTSRLEAGTYLLRAVVTTGQKPAGVAVTRAFEVVKTR